MHTSEETRKEEKGFSKKKKNLSPIKLYKNAM